MVGIMALVFCFAFAGSNKVSEASAVDNLQGTYRIVKADDHWGYAALGGLVKFTKTEDGVVGIAQNSPSNGNGFSKGAKVVYDIWEDGGSITCKVDYSIATCNWESFMTISNNGQVITLKKKAAGGLYWVLKKVN